MRRKRALWSVTVLMALFLIGATVRQKGKEEKVEDDKAATLCVGNILHNGDFRERATNYYAGWPAGWIRVWGAGHQKAGLKLDVAYDENMPFKGGRPVIKITAFKPLDNPDTARLDNPLGTIPMKIERGKAYKFTFWMRSDVLHTVFYHLDGGSGELVRKLGKDYCHFFTRPSNRADVTTDWKEFSAVYQVPPISEPRVNDEMDEVWMRLGLENGDYWMADASFVRVPEDK